MLTLQQKLELADLLVQTRTLQNGQSRTTFASMLPDSLTKNWNRSSSAKNDVLELINIAIDRNELANTIAILKDFEDDSIPMQKVLQFWTSIGNTNPQAQLINQTTQLPATTSQTPNNPSLPINPQPTPKTWWKEASNIIAIIGIFVGILLVMWQMGVFNASQSFDYQVKVVEQGTNLPISSADVTIAVPSIAPLKVQTDSTGLARLTINGDRAGKAGIVTVEASGYQTYTLNIDVNKDRLPTTIQLTKRTP